MFQEGSSSGFEFVDDRFMNMVYDEMEQEEGHQIELVNPCFYTYRY